MTYRFWPIALTRRGKKWNASYPLMSPSNFVYSSNKLGNIRSLATTINSSIFPRAKESAEEQKRQWIWILHVFAVVWLTLFGKKLKLKFLMHLFIVAWRLRIESCVYAHPNVFECKLSAAFRPHLFTPNFDWVLDLSMYSWSRKWTNSRSRLSQIFGLNNSTGPPTIVFTFTRSWHSMQKMTFANTQLVSRFAMFRVSRWAVELFDGCRPKNQNAACTSIVLSPQPANRVGNSIEQWIIIYGLTNINTHRS